MTILVGSLIVSNLRVVVLGPCNGIDAEVEVFREDRPAKILFKADLVPERIVRRPQTELDVRGGDLAHHEMRRLAHLVRDGKRHRVRADVIGRGLFRGLKVDDQPVRRTVRRPGANAHIKIPGKDARTVHEDELPLPRLNQAVDRARRHVVP